MLPQMFRPRWKQAWVMVQHGLQNCKLLPCPVQFFHLAGDLFGGCRFGPVLPLQTGLHVVPVDPVRVLLFPGHETGASANHGEIVPPIAIFATDPEFLRRL